MLKNFRFLRRKMQVEIFEKMIKIICTVCIALILFPLAAGNFKGLYADASDWFSRVRDKMQAEKLPWE